MHEAVRAFEEGNQHYAEGAYQDALAAYERALASGYDSGALYYNMGNAYFRLDELGQAIRYYEKARRLMPDDPNLLHSIEIANARVNTPISALPRPFWMAWWQRYVVRVGTLPFFIAGALCYGLAVGLIGHRIWTGTRNAWHRRVRSAALVVGLLLILTAFGASLDGALNQRVVVVEQAALRQAPRPDAASALTLDEGVVLDVLDRQAAWIEVRLPNGVTGWIEADTAAGI